MAKRQEKILDKQVTYTAELRKKQNYVDSPKLETVSRESKKKTIPLE